MLRKTRERGLWSSTANSRTMQFDRARLVKHLSEYLSTQKQHTLSNQFPPSRISLGTDYLGPGRQCRVPLEALAAALRRASRRLRCGPRGDPKLLETTPGMPIGDRAEHGCPVLGGPQQSFAFAGNLAQP